MCDNDCCCTPTSFKEAFKMLKELKEERDAAERAGRDARHRATHWEKLEWEVRKERDSWKASSEAWEDKYKKLSSLPSKTEYSLREQRDAVIAMVEKLEEALQQEKQENVGLKQALDRYETHRERVVCAGLINQLGDVDAAYDALNKDYAMWRNCAAALHTEIVQITAALAKGET